MAERVAITYDGADTVTAEITSGTPGQLYSMDASSTGIADSSGHTVFTTDLSSFGYTVGYRFGINVYRDTALVVGHPTLAVEVFAYGDNDPYEFDAVWRMPTDVSASVEFTDPTPGVTYSLQIVDNIVGGSTPVNDSGTGGPMTMTADNDAGAATLYPIADGSWAFLLIQETGEVLAETVLPLSKPHTYATVLRYKR